MKLVKMSLAAAILMGASAFAIDNVKVSGDAKLFYGTSDMGDNSLFDKAGAMGQAGAGLAISADLTDGISAGASTQAISTLGLENNLVGAIWAGTSLQTQWWFSEMWLAASMGNTTAKVGRQYLDTPFAFTETWNIASNSFDAAVLLNTDLPDTTIVGAWVGKHNGAGGFAVVNSPVDANGAQTDSFKTFGAQGAYAAAIINNSFKPLTVQAWYYDVVQVAHAYWLQADLSMNGLVAGAQYAAIDTTGIYDDKDDSSAVAIKLGYEADAFAVSGAYSQTDSKGFLDIANVATGSNGGAQSKLYTEAWWNFGYVGAADNSAFNITGSYDAGVVGVAAYYTMVDFDKKEADMTEFTLELTKSFGPLDTALVYIMTDADDVNDGDTFNTLQAYLTYNF
jgi:hypothetical protein